MSSSAVSNLLLIGILLLIFWVPQKLPAWGKALGKELRASQKKDS